MDFECIDALLDLPEFRVTNQVIRSCTSSLRVIPIARQSGTMPLSPPV
jgi:hypothetical protein